MREPFGEKKGIALVTGGAGFIGSWIVEEFVQQGWQVLAMVHRRSEARWERHVERWKVIPVPCDITDAAAVKSALAEALQGRRGDVEVVVHAAARASDVGRRSAFLRQNVEGVKNVGGWALEEGVRRLVLLSSTDVYGIRDFDGEAEDELPLELTVPNPYPESKILAEEWIRSTFPADRYSILRPGSVWGPGDTNFTPRILNFIRRSSRLVHFGPWKGRNRWPLTHVRNVAAAAFLAATRPEALGRAINVVDGDETTLDEFYRLLAGACLPGKTFRTLNLPGWLGRGVGRVVSLTSNLLGLDHPFMDPSHYAAHHASSNLVFGNARMLELFARGGHSLYSLEEGIRELAEASSLVVKR